jgi:hypothetical protein
MDTKDDQTPETSEVSAVKGEELIELGDIGELLAGGELEDQVAGGEGGELDLRAGTSRTSL